MIDRQNLDTALLERLSDAEHQSWASWMTYLFSVCAVNDDKQVVEIPRWAVDGWKAQAVTPYADLTDEEKGGDRREVRKILPVIESYVQERIFAFTKGFRPQDTIFFEVREELAALTDADKDGQLGAESSSYSWFRIMQSRNDTLITTPTLADRPGPEQRQAMIELAALAIACVQAIDATEKEKADAPVPG